MKGTLLAIDAIFAIRIAHDEVLPVVPLVTAFDLNEWKYRGDTGRSVKARLPEFRFPENSLDAAAEALHYMQTMDWVAKETRADTPVTLETVLHLHEMLLSGAPNDNRYHGFRSAPLPSGQEPTPCASRPRSTSYALSPTPSRTPRSGKPRSSTMPSSASSPSTPWSTARARARVSVHVQTRLVRPRVHGSHMLGRIDREELPKEAEDGLARSVVARGARAQPRTLGGLQRAQHAHVSRHRRFVFGGVGQVARQMALPKPSDSRELGARPAARSVLAMPGSPPSARRRSSGKATAPPTRRCASSRRRES